MLYYNLISLYFTLTIIYTLILLYFNLIAKHKKNPTTVRQLGFDGAGNVKNGLTGLRQAVFRYFQHLLLRKLQSLTNPVNYRKVARPRKRR